MRKSAHHTKNQDLSRWRDWRDLDRHW